jgi:DNA polymerase III delta prime subunit
VPIGPVGSLPPILGRVMHPIDGAGFRSLGQGTARRIVEQSARRGRLGRTLLVSGPPGAGKGAFVDDILALAFCAEPDPAARPCNACRACRDARARSHPDLVIGSPETWRELRSTGESIVAASRRWLLETSGAPVSAERRIVLIEGADRANEQTQNALLKALEEPTDRHTFILVADEPWRLLPTIRSRSQPVRVGPIPREQLTRFLIDDRQLPGDLAAALARLSHGLVGRAIQLVEHREVLEWRRTTQAELLALLERGRSERFDAVRELLDQTARLGSTAAIGAEDDEGARTPASVQRSAAVLLVDAWLELARDLLVVAAGRPELAPGSELGPELQRAGASVGSASLVAFVGLLEAIHDALRENASPRLALERAMLAWPITAGRPGS